MHEAGCLMQLINASRSVTLTPQRWKLAMSLLQFFSKTQTKGSPSEPDKTPATKLAKRTVDVGVLLKLEIFYYSLFFIRSLWLGIIGISSVCCLKVILMCSCVRNVKEGIFNVFGLVFLRSLVVYTLICCFLTECLSDNVKGKVENDDVSIRILIFFIFIFVIR